MSDNYTGAALLITSISGAATVALQIWTVVSGNTRDKKLTVLHDLVNSQSTALNKVTGDAAFQQGKAAGITQERDRL